MRPIWTLSGLAMLLASGVGVQAEDLRRITVPEVEARSGPSTKPEYYPTSKLRQGEYVKVLREENGWLAIEPPPESFSWINTLFLEHKPAGPEMVHVTGENVPVRVGSATSKEEPKVSQVKLSRGAIVYVIEPHGAATPEGNWLPISPPPGEVRYIPADAVKPQPEVQTVNSSPSGAAPGSASAPAPAHNAADDQLLAQAQDAERRGDARTARRLYHRLMLQTKDHDLQLLCANRENHLMNGHTGSVPQGYQSGTPSTASYPPQYNYGNRPPAYPAVQPIVPPSAPGSSSYTYYRDSVSRQPVQAIPASRVTPAPAPAAAAPAPPAPSAEWSSPGFLRRTRIVADGKRAYALETASGQLLLYASGQSVDLEPYVGKRVDLFGQITYRGDMYHKHYMPAVIQVREMP